MNPIRTALIAMLLTVAVTPAVWAADGPLTKEQAIEKALKAHPGEVLKAYRETKKGNETWEVKIKGEDGKTWEVYYKIADGELFMEKQDD